MTMSFHVLYVHGNLSFDYSEKIFLKFHRQVLWKKKLTFLSFYARKKGLNFGKNSHTHTHVDKRNFIIIIFLMISFHLEEQGWCFVSGNLCSKLCKKKLHTV